MFKERTCLYVREQGGDPRLVGGSSDPVEWSEAKASGMTLSEATIEWSGAE